MKPRTVVEMRDGTRGGRLIRASVSRKGDVEATKRYMLESFLRPYVAWVRAPDGAERPLGKPDREEEAKVRRAIVWRVVLEDGLGQEIAGGGAHDARLLASLLAGLSLRRPCNELAEEVISACAEDLPTQGGLMERWMAEELLMRQLGSSARANGDPGPAVMEARHQILAILDEIDGFMGGRGS